MTHSRFLRLERKALPDVAGEDERRISDSLDAVDGGLRASPGGVERTPGGAPGELEFYPRYAVAPDFFDRCGDVGSPERCDKRPQQMLDLSLTRVYIGTRGVGIDLEERSALRSCPKVLPLLNPVTV